MSRRRAEDEQQDVDSPVIRGMPTESAEGPPRRHTGHAAPAPGTRPRVVTRPRKPRLTTMAPPVETPMLVEGSSTPSTTQKSPVASGPSAERQKPAPPIPRRKTVTKTRRTKRQGKRGKADESAQDDASRIPVSLILDPDRDSHLSVPYAEDGDPAMDTDAAKRLRQRAREHPAVIDGLKAMESLVERAEDGSVPMHEYARLHFALTKVLRPGMSESSWRALMESDWQHDCHRNSDVDEEAVESPRAMLTAVQLRDALFEIVDLWTPSLDVADYASFLALLGEKVDAELKVLREEN